MTAPSGSGGGIVAAPGGLAVRGPGICDQYGVRRWLDKRRNDLRYDPRLSEQMVALDLDADEVYDAEHAYLVQVDLDVAEAGGYAELAYACAAVGDLDGTLKSAKRAHAIERSCVDIDGYERVVAYCQRKHDAAEAIDEYMP